jgi:hypothetical protein
LNWLHLVVPPLVQGGQMMPAWPVFDPSLLRDLVLTHDKFPQWMGDEFL